MFWVPVSEEDVPGYYDIITKPIALSDMQEKIQQNIYQTFGQFKVDCNQMFENAFGFNPRNSVFYQQATALQQLFHQLCSHLSNKLSVTTHNNAEFDSENVGQLINDLDRTVPVVQETPKKQTKTKAVATPAKTQSKESGDEDDTEKDSGFSTPKLTPSSKKSNKKKNKTTSDDDDDDETDSYAKGAPLDDDDEKPSSVLKKFIPKKESKEKPKPPAYERKRLYVELVNKLRQEDKMKIFYEAVPKETPGYFEIVKTPMDFMSLEKKSMQSKIVTLEDYKHNLELIFRNAMKFNEKNSVIYNEAERLLNVAIGYYDWLDEELDKAAKEFALNPRPTPKKEKKKEESSDTSVSETPSKKDKKSTEEDESGVLPSRLRKREDKRQDETESPDTGRSLRNRIVTPSNGKRDDAEKTEMPELTDSQLQELMPLVVNRLQANDIYDLYEKPVDTEEFPDYLDKVNEPMDFTTLRTNIEGEEYNDWQSFEHALESIFQNSKHYHPNDSFLYRDAHRIYRFWRSKVRKGIISEIRDGIVPKEIRVLQVPRKAGAITVVTLTPKAVAEGFGVREYGGKDRAPLSKFLKELIEDFIAYDKNKTFFYPDAKAATDGDEQSSSSSSKSDANPMDFCTLRKKIKLEKYRSFDAFKQDFDNLLSSVMRQHKTNSTIYREAKKLLDYSESKFKTVKARIVEEKPFIIEDKEDFTSPVYAVGSSSSQSTRKSVRTPLPGNKRDFASKSTFATPSKPPPRRIPIPPPTPYTPKTPATDNSYTPQTGTTQSFFQTPISSSLAPPETPAPTTVTPSVQYVTTPSYLFVDTPVHDTFNGRYYYENSGLMRPFDVMGKVVIKKKISQQVSEISTEEFESLLNANLLELATSKIQTKEDPKQQLQRFISVHQMSTHESDHSGFSSLLADLPTLGVYSEGVKDVSEEPEKDFAEMKKLVTILAKNDTSDTFSQILKDLKEIRKEDTEDVSMVEAKEYLEKLNCINTSSHSEQKKPIVIGNSLFATAHSQDYSITTEDRNAQSLVNSAHDDERENSAISTLLDSTHTDDTAMLLEDSEKQFL